MEAILQQQKTTKLYIFISKICMTFFFSPTESQTILRAGSMNNTSVSCLLCCPVPPAHARPTLGSSKLVQAIQRYVERLL